MVADLCKAYFCLMHSSIFRSMFARGGGGGRMWRSIGGRMLMSTMGAPSSPWLMLPPGRDCSSGHIIHNFYSIGDNKNHSFDGGFAMEDGTRFVGSSHGWLALFNDRNNHLFLTDPLSGHRLDLPPVDKLYDPEINLTRGRASVSKVVLSCSPDGGEDEWRALMTFGLGNRLAFCSAGRSDGWTPIGEFLQKKKHPSKCFVRNYEDFVYCRAGKSFICSPNDTCFNNLIEYWFVGDDAEDPVVTKIERHRWSDEIPEEVGIEYGDVFYIPHLVFVEQLNQLFFLIRYVTRDYPHETLRFLVFRADNEHSLMNTLRWLRPDQGDSLDGLAMFVGINHSFAITAKDFPNINPNSIYFTHVNYNFTSPDSLDGCEDIGVFDFETQTVSPCSYYPSQGERIAHPPLWFTPTSPH